jgi:predicted SAM-dependent methyltransferase
LTSLLASRIPRDGQKLHIGCGGVHLEGWVNIDSKPLPSVDVIADVTKEIPFIHTKAIYAEHFLEHLELDQAIDFLLEAHRVLDADAWIRLSTPNLDWVWATHYDCHARPERQIQHALHANRAFYGWQHRFLWNKPILEQALTSCGFIDLTWCRYTESEHLLFRGIERHEPSQDSVMHTHVIIVEARKGSPRPQELAEFQELARGEYLRHR